MAGEGRDRRESDGGGGIGGDEGAKEGNWEVSRTDNDTKSG